MSPARSAPRPVRPKVPARAARPAVDASLKRSSSFLCPFRSDLRVFGGLDLCGGARGLPAHTAARRQRRRNRVPFANAESDARRAPLVFFALDSYELGRLLSGSTPLS